MPRPLVYLLLLAMMGVPALTGCRTDTMREAESSRSLASVLPKLTKDLTPATARARLGAPDEETGSGLIIYKYRLADRQVLWLGFPGYAPITYAQLERADGVRSNLTLRQ
jgi:hypothetical protein